MEFDGSNLIRISDQQTRVSEAKHPMTLHCQQCNTVLGDSQSVCGEISCLDSIMCLSKFISRITTASLFRNSLNRAATRKCKSSHERCAACKFHDSAFRNKYKEISTIYSPRITLTHLGERKKSRYKRPNKTLFMFTIVFSVTIYYNFISILNYCVLIALL